MKEFTIIKDFIRSFYKFNVSYLNTSFALKDNEGLQHDRDNRIKGSSLCLTAISAAMLFASLSFYFTDAIDFIKTIANLYDHKNLKPFAFAVLMGIFILALFIKSVFEIMLYVFEKVIIKNRPVKISKYTVLHITAIILIVSAFAVLALIKLNQEIKSRNYELNLLKSAVTELNSRNLDYELFADRIPSVYKNSGFKIKSKLTGFDTIALNKTPNIVVTCPNDFHYFLTFSKYRFVKISDKLSLFVRDENLIKAIEDTLSVKFSDSYYFKKDLDLSYVAKENRIKSYSENSLPIKGKTEISLGKEIYYPAGKYRISVHIEKAADSAVSGKIGLIELTASSGQIKLHSKEIGADDFTDNQLEYTISLNVDYGYHNLETKLRLNSSLDASIKKVTYEKLP